MITVENWAGNELLKLGILALNTPPDDGCMAAAETIPVISPGWSREPPHNTIIFGGMKYVCKR